MGLKTEKSSIRVSMRDFCHEASPFLRVLTWSRYRVTHSLKTDILKQVFILRNSFNSHLLLFFTSFFAELYCFLLNEVTDCHALT